MKSVTSCYPSRYHILHGDRTDSAIVFDAETGAVQRPACWQDLSAFYHYLVGRGRIDESQALLAESMAGTLPITRMLSCIAPAARDRGRP
jgi:hypothetical protein